MRTVQAVSADIVSAAKMADAYKESRLRLVGELMHIALRRVSEISGIAERSIKGRGRTSKVADARHAWIHLLGEWSRLTTYELAGLVGRDRATVRYARARAIKDPAVMLIVQQASAT